MACRTSYIIVGVTSRRAAVVRLPSSTLTRRRRPPPCPAVWPRACRVAGRAGRVGRGRKKGGTINPQENGDQSAFSCSSLTQLGERNAACG